MPVEYLFESEEWEQHMISLESMHAQIDFQADIDLTEAKQVSDAVWQDEANAAVYAFCRS